MWTIIVRDPQGQEIARNELTAGALVVGRGKDCNIVLPSGAVSRKHARFELRGDKLYFFDEGSANGSLVDGRRVVAPLEVNSASVIEITPFRISLEGGDDDGEKTVMIKRPAPPPRPAAPMPAAPAAAPMAPRPGATTLIPPRPAAAPAPPHAAAPPMPPRPAMPATPPPMPPRPAMPAAPPMPPRPTVAAPVGIPSVADLRPMAPPPPPPRPAPSATDTAFTIRFPETPTAAPASAPAPKGLDESDAAAELERHIRGIRSYREQGDTNTNTRIIQLEQSWLQVLSAMQSLKSRLTGNPRLQGFGMSRDGKEVTIRLSEPREKRGFRYFVLARHHPEGKFPGLDAVWVCETGREDMSFRDPKDAQTELLQRIAATLA